MTEYGRIDRRILTKLADCASVGLIFDHEELVLQALLLYVLLVAVLHPLGLEVELKLYIY